MTQCIIPKKMECSNNIRIKDEIADAMQSGESSRPLSSSSSSSSSSFEVIGEEEQKLNSFDRDKQTTCELYVGHWQCRLKKRDCNWILYINDMQTLLQFSGTQNVTLESNNNQPCLRADAKLYIVSISRDGETKLTPAKDTELHAVEEKEVMRKSGKEQLSSNPCQTDSYKTFGAKQPPEFKEEDKSTGNVADILANQLIDQTDNSVDQRQKTSDKMSKESIRLYVKSNHWVLCVEEIETYLEFEEKQRVTLEFLDDDIYIKTEQEIYKVYINFDKKARFNVVEEADVLRKIENRQAVRKTSHGNSSQSSQESSAGDLSVPSHQIFVNNKVEMTTGVANHNGSFPASTGLGPEREQTLCDNDSPTLTIDKVNLLRREEGWFLQVGAVEKELHFAGTANVTMEKADGDLYIAANDELYEVKLKPNEEVYIVRVEEAIIIPANEDNASRLDLNESDTAVDLHGATEVEQQIKPSTGLRLQQSDTLTSLNREAIINNQIDVFKSGPSSTSDENISYITEKLESLTIKGTNSGLMKESHEEGNIPYLEKTTTCHRSDGKRLLTGMTRHQRSTDVTFANYAKTTYDLPKTHKNTTATYASTVRNTPCSSDDSVRDTRLYLTAADEKDNKKGQHENRLPTTHAAERPGSKRVASKPRTAISLALVKVHSLKDFNYLRESEYIKQLASDKEIIIKAKQVSDCWGFEVEGAADSVQKAETKLKKIIADIASCSLVLYAERKSMAEAKQNLSWITTNVKAKLDVLITHAWQVNSESVETIQSHSKENARNNTDAHPKSVTNPKTGETENSIEKIVDTPNMVSWHFPRGYRISLCKQSVKHATADVHVTFKNWSGNEEQLSSMISPDGIGGYIISLSAGLPKYRQNEHQHADLTNIFSRILQKAGDDDQNHVAFSLENIQNWTFVLFLECLLTAVWEHFKAPNRDKPIFIGLFHPSSAEYQTANFHCIRLIMSSMNPEIEFLNPRQLETIVVEGKLDKTKAEVLVNTTSKDLALKHGAVSSALLKAGGDGLQIDCYMYYPKGIEWGEIAVTRGHKLQCKYVFHGALPAYYMLLDETKKLTAFRTFMSGCLTKAAELGCRSIAFPVLGAGILKYPVNLVASEMFTCIQKFLQMHKRSSLLNVYIVVYPTDTESLKIFRKCQAELERDKQEYAKRTQQELRLVSLEKDQGDLNESLKIEITGLHEAIKEAKHFIESEWRKITTDKRQIYKMRLPSVIGQSVLYGHGKQHDSLERMLKESGAEIFEEDAKFFVQGHCLTTLQKSFSLINEYRADTGEWMHISDEFSKMDIFVQIPEVSETVFMAIEKLYPSTINKCERNKIHISYRKECLIIHGIAENIEPARNELKKLIAYLESFETVTMDTGELKTDTETLSVLIKETKSKGHERCILFYRAKDQLTLLSKNMQDLMKLRHEILTEIQKFASRPKPNGSSKQSSDQSSSEQAILQRKMLDVQKIQSPIRVNCCGSVISIFINEGNILTAPVSCIVNAANEHLSHNAGVAAAIANAAGSSLVKESDSHIKRYHKVSVGDVVITTAGNLKYRFVLHAVGPSWHDYQPLTRSKLQDCKNALQSAVRKCLDNVQFYKLKSVAIPAISSGYLGVPLEICAVQYAEAIKQYVKHTKYANTVEEIHFISLNKDVIGIIQQTFYTVFVENKIVNVDAKFLPPDQHSSSNKDRNGPKTCPLHEMHKSNPAEETGPKLTGGSKVEKAKLPRVEQPYLACAEKPGIAKDLPDISDQSSTAVSMIRFVNGHELQLYTANILELQLVDIIVVTEDMSGHGKGTVAQGMLIKGGQTYKTAKEKAFKSKPSFGDVIITQGGESTFAHVFHALVHHRQHFSKDMPKWYNALQNILRKIFSETVRNGCCSIAMPFIGADPKTQDVSEYARAFLKSYKGFCLAYPTNKLTVHLVSNEPSWTKKLQSLFERNISKHRPTAMSSSHSSIESIFKSQDDREKSINDDTINQSGKSASDDKLKQWDGIKRPTNNDSSQVHDGAIKSTDDDKMKPHDERKRSTYDKMKERDETNDISDVKTRDEGKKSADDDKVNKHDGGKKSVDEDMVKRDGERKTANDGQVKECVENKKSTNDAEKSDAERKKSTKSDKVKPNGERKKETNNDEVPDEHSKLNSNGKEDCVICLDDMKRPKKLKCGHMFCSDCIGEHMKTKKNCPICGKTFGTIVGNQPPGEMKHEIMPNPLPGYKTCKTIRIVYVFPSGTQGPEHPEPGMRYTGISRTAFLPDNAEGRQILKLLDIAFKRKLTFTIGQSRTTGQTGVITWNDIHHKTNIRPNSQFGYPDPTYFERVKEELAAKGVTVDDIK